MRRQEVHNLLQNRIRILLRPLLNKALTPHTIKDMKYLISNDLLIKKFTAFHFDIVQNEYDLMSLKVVNSRLKHANWKKL
jgi:hypothetical protein